MMNVEGLSRENVASHLQKYRLHRKKRDADGARAAAGGGGGGGGAAAAAPGGPEGDGARAKKGKARA